MDASRLSIMILVVASSARNGSTWWSESNEEGTLSVPAVPAVVGLAMQGLYSASAAQVPQVWEEGPRTARTALDGSRTATRLDYAAST